MGINLLTYGMIYPVLLASFTSALCGCGGTPEIAISSNTKTVATISADPVAYWNFDGADPKQAAISGGLITTGGLGTAATDRLATTPAGSGAAIKLDYQSVMMQAPLQKPLTSSYSIEFSLKYGRDAFRNAVTFPDPRQMQFIMTQAGVPLAIQFGSQSIRVLELIQDPNNPNNSVSGPSNQFDDILISLTGTGVHSVGYYLDGRAHHFVVQRDSEKGVFEVWIDGTRFYTASRSGPLFGNGIEKIAFGTSWGPDRFQGELDELAIYSSPLDYSLIKAHSDQIAGGKSYERSAPVAGMVPDGILAGTEPTINDLDPKEFTPGAQIPTVGNQTLGATMQDPLDQVKNAPAPRYATTNAPNPPLRKLFNWMDPKYLSGHAQQWAYLSYRRTLQPGQSVSTTGLDTMNAERNANIQVELAKTFNYGLNLSVHVNWGSTPVPDPSTPASLVTDIHPLKVLQTMKANPSYTRDVIVFGNLYHPSMSGSELINCLQGSSQSTCVSPAGPTGSTSKTYMNGRAQGRVIQSLIATLAETGANGRSSTNAIDRINENGEFSRWTANRAELGANSAVSASELAFARARDPSGTYTSLNGTEAGTPAVTARWNRYVGDRYGAFVSSLRDGLKYQSGLSGVNYTLYQVSALSGDAYPGMRTINTPTSGAAAGCQSAGGCNAPTADFYPRWPSNWPNRAGPWNGLGFFEQYRPAEIALGDRLMTPFLSAGWDTRAEINFLPSQYLANLKLLGLLGAESFYSGYFTLGGDIDGDGLSNQMGTDTRLGDFGDSRLWAWNALMPAYAQAVISRAVDYLRSGDLLKREKQLSNETDTYRIWAGDPRVVIYVRKLTGQSKYLIGSAMQRDSNDKNASPATQEVTASIDGTPFTFTTRIQGAVFLLDRSVNPPTVTQLDSWHEPGHPNSWSKTIVMENEIYDDARGIRLKTEMKRPRDFSWFRTSLAFKPSAVREGSARVSYTIQPRHEQADSWRLSLVPTPSSSKNARVRVEIFHDHQPRDRNRILNQIVSLHHPDVRGIRLQSNQNYRVVLTPLTEGVEIDHFRLSPMVLNQMASQ